MPHRSAAQVPFASLIKTSSYADDLLPELQTMLAILADLEVEYQKDREQLTAWVGPNPIKESFAAQLEECHRREREPYVQRLDDLHQQIMTVMGLADCGAVT